MKDLSERISQLITEKELVEMTMEMIKIPSYAGIENQETGVAKYIKSIFDREEIPCRIEEVEAGRCNVIATLKGDGNGKSLLLNGHTDTVEPNDMQRAFDPYIEDNKLYGRGASDMKGPIVSMMGAMIAIKRGKIKMAGDVTFTGVLDEEHNSIGTIDLIEKGIKAHAAIVGEPSNLQICTGHRGLEWYEFKFIGKTVHGGRQKEGVNAIAKAVKFINALEADLIPKVYERKHSLLEEATVNYGVIHGGTQLSTVAGECSLFVDRRFLPYEDYEEVTKEFQQLIDKLSAEDKDFKCNMRVTQESAMKEGYVHKAMEISKEHPVVKVVSDAVLQVTDKPPVYTFFPAWTDGGLLSNYADIPTVVIGPGIIECCHSKEEHIPVDHLMKGCILYALTAINFCNSK